MRRWLKLWSCSSPPSKRSAEIHSNIRGIKRRITSCRYPSGLCVRIDAIREWASARVGLYNILKSTRKHMQLAQLAITSRSLTDSQTPGTPPLHSVLILICEEKAYNQKTSRGKGRLPEKTSHKITARGVIYERAEYVWRLNKGMAVGDKKSCSSLRAREAHNEESIHPRLASAGALPWSKH